MSLVFICSLLYNYLIRYRYFRILETTKNAKSYLRCRIKLMTKRAADQLTFDELWIDDRLYKIKITNEENIPAEKHFREKEILYIDIESEVQNPASAPPTEKSRSKIFLGYQVDNKRRYFPIRITEEELPQLSVA